MNPYFPNLSFLILLGASVPLQAGMLNTNFEFNDTGGSFTLTNDSGDSATFSGGEAKTIGVFSLYRSGTHAWMVAPETAATVDLSPSARELTVFLRNQSSGTRSTLELLDENGGILATFTGSSADWLEVNVSEASLGAPVAQIILRNQGSEGYAVLDDFSFSAAETTTGQKLEDPIPAPIEKGQMRLRLKPVASGLTAPNWAVPAPGDSEYLYVGDQDGKLWRIRLADGSKEIFLDLSGLLIPLGAFGSDSFDERGFLGFAFHPQYAENGLLYTYTSEPADESSDFSTLPPGTHPDHRSVIREWQLNPDDSTLPLTPAQGRILLSVDQPQFNHDAGALNFGPDGRLYIALGDGGGADDRDGQEFTGSPMVGHGADGNGQDTGNPLGTLLRIDPAGNDSANGRYGIPEDNPFVGSAAGLDEIYAFGFRNPFRFSFDSETGALYLADVGQNDIEEVDLIQAGGNYGWSLKEGKFRFEPNGNDPGFVTNEPVAGDLIDPVAQYDHDEGTAIIGGFVYRGGTVSALNGKYVFGDVAKTGASDGRLFYLDGGVIREVDLTEREQPGFWFLGFGQDAEGELYVLGNTTGVPFGTTGAVYKLVPNADFDFTTVEIPAVDVTLNNGSSGVYRARLALVQGSQPFRFKLVHAEQLSENFRGNNAIFDQPSGELMLPFVNVVDAVGGLSAYSAELRQVPNTLVLTFELIRAERLK